LIVERRSLIVGAGVLALDTFGYASVMPLLPFAGRDVGLSYWAIGVLFATFSACQLLAVPWIGVLADRFGTTLVLAGCLAGTAAGFAILVFSVEPWALLASRVIDGLSAGNVAVVFAMVVREGRSGERSARLGVLGAAMGAGLLAGVAFGALAAGQGLPFAATVAMAAAIVAASVVLLAPVPSAAESLAGPRLGRQWVRPGARSLAATQVTSSGVQAGFLLIAPVLFVSQLGVELAVALGSLVLFLVVGGLFQVVALAPLTRIVRGVVLVRVSFVLMAAGVAVAGFSGNRVVVLTAGCLASVGAVLAAPPLAALWAALPGSSGEFGVLMGLNASSSSAGQLIGPLVAYGAWALAGAAGTAVALVAVCGVGLVFLRRSQLVQS
jgi:DHA1 family tetracycline resistance protein-like MFS transporter